jgi:hypothetical protein
LSLAQFQPSPCRARTGRNCRARVTSGESPDSTQAGRGPQWPIQLAATSAHPAAMVGTGMPKLRGRTGNEAIAIPLRQASNGIPLPRDRDFAGIVRPGAVVRCRLVDFKPPGHSVGDSQWRSVGAPSAPRRSARRPPSPRAGAGAKSIRYSRSAAPAP